MKSQYIKHMNNATHRQISFIKSFRWSLILLILAFFANGCALTKDYVVLSYDPQVNVGKIKGADAVKVRVQVSDVRAVKEKVSCKKNAYGMEMAPIIAQNDPVITLKTAIETELKNRGFILAEGSVLVLTELNKYYNDFKTGAWSGKAVGEVVMNVQVKKSDDSIILSKLVEGGCSASVQVASGKNAKYTLDGALKDAVSKLFGDASFTDSLFRASQNRYITGKESYPLKEKPETTMSATPQESLDGAPKQSPPRAVGVSPKSSISIPEKPMPSTVVTPSLGTLNTITVTWTSANIRSGAGNNYPVITTVKQGDMLTVIGEYVDWFNVRLENGQQGWISNRVVK